MCGLGHIYVLLGEASLGLALIALALVALSWRLFGSDLGLAAQPYRVMEVIPRAAGMVEISLAPCATRLRVSPGQFVLAAFGKGPHYQGCREFHPFSVSGIGSQGVLTVSVKALGPCTRHIQEIEPDVLARLQGPFGTFLVSSLRAPQLWVAGGVGITPFIAALRQGPVPQPTSLIYVYRTEQDAAFLDELSELAKADPKFELLTEASGDNLPNVDGLLGRVSRLVEREVWLCGPVMMVETLRARLQQHGLQPHAIHFESFDFR